MTWAWTERWARARCDVRFVGTGDCAGQGWGIDVDRGGMRCWETMRRALTADVHCCAAHRYDPARAAFDDFNPSWEFVSGTVHAGTFGPNALDATFGPEVRFQKAATRPNMAPSEGYQFFGVADIDARSRALTVRLVDVAGDTLFTQTLDPGR